MQPHHQDPRPPTTGRSAGDETDVGDPAAPSGARDHLERLGTVLQRRGWRVSLLGGDRRPELHVTNPAAPAFSEIIECRRLPTGWRYFWGWKEPIGPVERVRDVADRVAYVLREIPDEVTEAAEGAQ